MEPRSMPGIHEIRDEVEIDDIDEGKEEEEEDEDLSDTENMEILDPDEDSINNTLYPKIVQTNSATVTSSVGSRTPNGTHSSGTTTNSTGYVSRRKKNRSFGNGRRFSHSHSRSTGMLDIPPPS